MVYGNLKIKVASGSSSISVLFVTTKIRKNTCSNFPQLAYWAFPSLIPITIKTISQGSKPLPFRPLPTSLCTHFGVFWQLSDIFRFAFPPNNSFHFQESHLRCVFSGYSTRLVFRCSFSFGGPKSSSASPFSIWLGVSSYLFPPPFIAIREHPFF